MKDLTKPISNSIFSIRWLLLPFSFGLVAVLAVYLIRFLIDDYHFILDARHMSLEELKLGGLSLIDAYMIANLYVMIIKGSYQIFIAKFHTTDDDRPQWLDHVDTGLLKVKLGQSIAAISSIQLLKDYTNLDHGGWQLAQQHAALHVIFLISAAAMAIIWKITQSRIDHEKTH